MLKLIMWVLLCYGLVTLGIAALLWKYIRKCFINDVKTALYEAYDIIEPKHAMRQKYNQKND